MSLTTKPPAGDVPVRPDAPPPGVARPRGPGAPALDEAAATKLLIDELIAIVTAELGPRPAPPDAAGVAGDPRGVAGALISWLNAATESGGAGSARLATLIERAYGRVLEALARLPGGLEGGEASARLARNILLAELLAAAPPLQRHAAGAMPLKLLVAELERAVVEELGVVAPAPRPASGEEPGNVAAALIRWLRAVAATADVPLVRLRGAAERALGQTRAMLLEDAALPGALEELDKASDVLLAAIGRAPRADVPPVPTFRPDLPLTPAGSVRRRRAPPVAGRAPEEGRDGDEVAEATADEPGAPPAAQDLKGPMELIRRYHQDLESGEPKLAARHFVYPACRWHGGRWQAFADAPALAAASTAGGQEPASHRRGGGRILMLRAEPVGPDVATVRALIERDGKPGERPEEVEVAYTTVLTPAGWRIAVAMLP